MRTKQRTYKMDTDDLYDGECDGMDRHSWDEMEK